MVNKSQKVVHIFSMRELHGPEETNIGPLPEMIEVQYINVRYTNETSMAHTLQKEM